VTVQRKRGQPLKLWPMVQTVDNRGNKTLGPGGTPHETKGWVIPQRSSKAEVPGQQQINVIRIGVAVLPGVGLWSQAEWDGRLFDVAAPPAYHHGTRHVRHWSIDLRERPGGATKEAIDG
jgi:hypothetical protein